MTGRRLIAVLFAVSCAPHLVQAQIPLEPPTAKGNTVTPVFEGWYTNPDGTYSLSFGYFNRNSAEALEVPVGPDNYMQPGDADRGQPTRFEPGRHWGVFAVTVPADFGFEDLVWTLNIRGESFTVPGSLMRHWQIDAIRGEAGSGNTPPTLRFDRDGPAKMGPGGLSGNKLATNVGKPLAISVWASDDGKPAGTVYGYRSAGYPVTLTWYKHQGPGEVAFSESRQDVDHEGGEAKTTVTFSEPGDYVLRVRATDASGYGYSNEPNFAMAGYAQCCWTNGFVPVTVTE